MGVDRGRRLITQQRAGALFCPPTLRSSADWVQRLGTLRREGRLLQGRTSVLRLACLP